LVLLFCQKTEEEAKEYQYQPRIKMAEEIKMDHLVMLVSNWLKPMNKSESCNYFSKISKATIGFMESKIEMVLQNCSDSGLLLKESGLYTKATLEDSPSVYNIIAH